MTVREARLRVLEAGGTLQARNLVKELRALAESTGRSSYAAEADDLEHTIDLADGVDRAAITAEPTQADLFGGAA